MISKLAWIKKQQAAFQTQTRQPQLEMVHLQERRHTPNGLAGIDTAAPILIILNNIKTIEYIILREE